MRKILIICIFIAIVCLSAVEAKRQKKPKTIERPREVEAHLYCDACKAITTELLKKLQGSTTPVTVLTALSDICDQKYYYTYEYPPPDMQKGCHAFVGAGHDEVLEKVLLNRKSDDGIIEEICFEKTQACKDLPKGRTQPRNDVTINGVPVDYKIETATPDQDL